MVLKFFMIVLLVEVLVADQSVSYIKTDVQVIDCDLNPQIGSKDTTSQLGCSNWCSRVEECDRYKFCPFLDGNQGGECVLHKARENCLSTDEANACICMVKKSIKLENGTYLCQSGFYGNYCENIVKDCKHASEISEIYDTQVQLIFVQPTLASKPIEVYCKMFPTPLVLISLRMYSTVCNNVFNKTWAEYRDGFGSVTSGYWLGLQKLYTLTNEPGRNVSFQILVANSVQKCANLYTDFKITDELDDFRISFGNSLNSANINTCQEGMRMTGLEAEGQPFSTYDHYNGSYDCPNIRQSGWWFAEHSQCTSTNVNGDFKFTGQSSIYWRPDFNVYAVTFVEMSFKLN